VMGAIGCQMPGTTCWRWPHGGIVAGCVIWVLAGARSARVPQARKDRHPEDLRHRHTTRQPAAKGDDGHRQPVRPPASAIAALPVSPAGRLPRCIVLLASKITTTQLAGSARPPEPRLWG
jgi:hypothetical protein